MTSFSVMRRDHYDADNDGTVDAAPLSDDSPAALGTANSGTGSSAARSDHVHAMPNRARGAYDAIVYIQDGDVIAEDATGDEIDSGDAGTDDVSVINAAISHVSPFNVIQFSGNFVIDGEIVINKSITLNCDGAIFVSSVGSAAYCMRAYGALVSTIVITDNVAQYSNTISISDTSLIQSGDLVLIYDDTQWGPSTNGDIYFGWKTGELHEIKSVSADTSVTLTEELNYGYTTTKNATALIYRPITIIINDLNMVGAGASSQVTGPAFFYTSHSRIVRPKIRNFGGYALAFFDSYDSEVISPDITSSNYASIGYGIAIYNACAHTRVIGGSIRNCRHCVSANGSTFRGVSRNNVIDGAHLVSSEQSNTVDAHPVAESLFVLNCDIQSTGGVASVYSGAKKTVIKNCHCVGGGFGFRAEMTNAAFYIVGNIVTGNGAYLFITNENSTKSSIDILQIVNNDVENASIGIRQTVAAFPIYMLDVRNNRISHTTYPSPTNIFMNVIGATGGVVVGNRDYHSYQHGIYLTNCENLCIDDNEIIDPAVASSGSLYGVFLNNVTDCKFRRNRVSDSVPRMKYALVETGDSDTNRFENNLFDTGTSGYVTYVGASDVFQHNTGHITENSGSSTGTGSEQTIAHGLVAAPSKVAIVPTETGVTVSAVWADATNIYCTVTTGKAFNWSAEV